MSILVAPLAAAVAPSWKGSPGIPADPQPAPQPSNGTPISGTLWPSYPSYRIDDDDAEALPNDPPAYKPFKYEYPCNCDIKLLLSYGHEKECLYMLQKKREAERERA